MARALLPSLLRAASFIAGLSGAFVAFAASGRAGDWYVDVQAPDCVHADGSAAAPFCTIAEAVNAAASSDTIHIAAGTYFENVTIDRSLHLIGTSGAAATIVDGGGLDSVFTVASGTTVELEGLTITHGKARYGGGVSIEKGCIATATACVVSNNQADAVDALGVRLESHGGGIYASEAQLTVASSTISDNFANAGGGGIACIAVSPFTVADCVVSRNQAGGSDGFWGSGGGIFEAMGAIIRVTRTTFEANRYDRYNGDPYFGGGGIYSEGPDCVFDHLIVRDNSAPVGGGVFGNGTGQMLTDSLFEGNIASFLGGGACYTCGSTIERCTFRDNRCSGSGAIGTNSYGSAGGGLAANWDVTDCIIEDNVAEENVGNGPAQGGGVFFRSGPECNLVRCVIRGNTAIAVKGGGIGGGVAGEASLPHTITDCEIVGNVATAAATGTAGQGGGVALVFDSAFGHPATFTRCTIAGNSAEGLDGLPAGDGGGVWIEPGSIVPVFTHTIIAGNRAVSTGSAPDLSGTIDSKGFNLIGDTTGATITGDGTGNQLDVDPRFADPGQGDFSLAVDSPALDAGDPAQQPAGTDVAGHPRVLDGDLDRAMVLDLGALEFDHVNLAVVGAPTPGATLTFTTTGTAGLPVLLCVGTASGELRIAPLGSLLFDVGSPWFLLTWGTIPDQQSFTVDPNLPVPVTFILQPLTLDPVARTGNLGNAVRLDFE